MRRGLRTVSGNNFDLNWYENQCQKIRTFAELLDIGLEQGVDLVILGGDLFHENKPSRAAEIKCLQILRQRVLGDRPVQVLACTSICR